MKVIFLDIDGVLNTFHSMCRGLTKEVLHHFQKSCVQELNRIIRKTGAKIVVSSTWRKNRDWPKVMRHIHREGVVGEILGRTGVTEDRIRGHEIEEWLAENPVKSFVILDDDSDMDRLMDRLVLTNMQGGLRREHGKPDVLPIERRLIEWLGEKESNLHLRSQNPTSCR